METVRIEYTAVSGTEVLYVDARFNAGRSTPKMRAWPRPLAQRLKERMSPESWFCEDYLDALVYSSLALYVRLSYLFMHEGPSL